MFDESGADDAGGIGAGVAELRVEVLAAEGVADANVERAVIGGEAGCGGGGQAGGVAEDAGVVSGLGEGAELGVTVGGVGDDDLDRLDGGGTGVGVGIGEGDEDVVADLVVGGNARAGSELESARGRAAAAWDGDGVDGDDAGVVDDFGDVGFGAAGGDGAEEADFGEFARAHDGNGETAFIDRERSDASVGDGVVVFGGGVEDVIEAGREGVEDGDGGDGDEGFVVEADGVFDDVADGETSGGVVGEDARRFGHDGRGEGGDGGSDIEEGVAGTGDCGVLAPGTSDEGAVEGVEAHGGLVAIGVVDAEGLEGLDGQADIASLAGGIGDGTGAVAIVVDVECGIGDGGDPDGAAVLGEVGAAGAPADDEGGGEAAGRDEAEAPVVDVVGAGAGTDGDDTEESVIESAIEVDTRVLGHLVAEGVVGGDGEGGGAGAGGGGDGDGEGVGVVEEAEGLVTVGGGADGGVVANAPLVGGGDAEPARLVISADVTGHEVDLDGLIGGDSGASEDAGGREVDLTFVERDRGLEGAVGVGIDLNLGAGFDGLDK